MSELLTTDERTPEIIPWPELQKRAEREGIDIMDYVNSMHAHILNQRDELARLKGRNEKLVSVVRDIAGCGNCPACRDTALAVLTRVRS